MTCPRRPIPRRVWCPGSASSALKSIKRIAAAATGLRDPFGIIVVARAAGATGDVPLQPRDIIRSLNNRQMLTLQALRDAVARPHAWSAGDPADSA